jgi:hypothetical protein
MMATIALQPYSPSVQVSFSGHETFVLRYSWLKKAYDSVVRDPTLFGREDAIVELGVGKNMVRSIRHWALACRVLQEEPKSRGLRLSPAPFGTFLFGPDGKDPYLEDINSLWLIHWHLCTNENRATTWDWAFSILRTTEFTAESLFVSLQGELARRRLKAPTSNTLRRDIDVFIRTYLPSRVAKKNVLEDSLDSPLAELGILVSEGSDAFTFVRGPHRSLDDGVFAAAVIDFWTREAPRRETLSFNELAYSPNSPGCVFKLDEDSLLQRLENLERVSLGCLLFADTAGLKQIYRKSPIRSTDLLENYYAAGMRD